MATIPPRKYAQRFVEFMEWDLSRLHPPLPIPLADNIVIRHFEGRSVNEDGSGLQEQQFQDADFIPRESEQSQEESSPKMKMEKTEEKDDKTLQEIQISK